VCVDTRPFRRASRKSVRVSKTIAAQGIFAHDEISLRAWSERELQAARRIARAGAVGAARRAAASAVHDSLSGVAVFLIVL
jgi:hypothetical protein